MALPIDEVIPGASRDLGILLIHGLTGTPEEMGPVGEAFVGRFPLYVVRVAGHATSVAELARTSWGDWYRSANAGADALLKVVPRIVLVGLSMGAVLSVRLAAARTDAVAGVVLLSPAIAISRAVVRWLGLPFRMLAAADAASPALQRLLAPLALAKAGSDIADLDVRRGHPGYRRVPLRALLNLLALQRLAWNDAPAVTQPTLLIHATNDHTVPVAAARLLFERLGTRDKRLVVLDESFHVVTVDRERAVVLAELETFIDRLATRPSST